MKIPAGLRAEELPSGAGENERRLPPRVKSPLYSPRERGDNRLYPARRYFFVLHPTPLIPPTKWREKILPPSHRTRSKGLTDLIFPEGGGIQRRKVE
jgi:hypothetical protein